MDRSIAIFFCLKAIKFVDHNWDFIQEFNYCFFCDFLNFWKILLNFDINASRSLWMFWNHFFDNFSCKYFKKCFQKPSELFLMNSFGNLFVILVVILSEISQTIHLKIRRPNGWKSLRCIYRRNCRRNSLRNIQKLLKIFPKALSEEFQKKKCTTNG